MKNNKSFQYKIKQCKNYFNYNKKIHLEIISYLESLFKFKDQVVDLPIFTLYYNKDKSYLSSSINYFLYIYYREFNSNILNKTFLCPKCKKFNFLENSWIVWDKVVLDKGVVISLVILCMGKKRSSIWKFWI